MAQKKIYKDEEEEEDYYSPTSYDRGPEESDEDYLERMEDLGNQMDRYND